MPKYYYKPILSIVKETYLENAKQEYTAEINIEENARMVVEAPTQESAFAAMHGFVDIRMWELEKFED